MLPGLLQNSQLILGRYKLSKGQEGIAQVRLGCCSYNVHLQEDQDFLSLIDDTFHESDVLLTLVRWCVEY